MKRIILALTLLLATSSAASAQTASAENLRGLTGVRLVVMFNGASRDAAMGVTPPEGLEALQRPEVLKMLEDDMKAKLEKAGVPFSRSRIWDERNAKDYARLVVRVTLKVPNGFVHPLEPEMQLMQTVRLARDPSIEFEAVSWSHGGVGNKAEIPMMRSLIADLIDSFIRDYLSVNPKQSASSGKDKSRDTKH